MRRGLSLGILIATLVSGIAAAQQPAPNYPTGNRRTKLEMPEPFVVLTAAGYFFMPSITALRSVLT